MEQQIGAARLLQDTMVLSDADFRVSEMQNRFKQSSTALLSITFIIFFAYSIVKFLVHRKTNFGTQQPTDMNEILPIIIKVIEHDLAPSLLVFFCIMGLGEFYVFAAVFGYFILLLGGLLVLAYKMHN